MVTPKKPPAGKEISFRISRAHRRKKSSRHLQRLAQVPAVSSVDFRCTDEGQPIEDIVLRWWQPQCLDQG